MSLENWYTFLTTPKITQLSKGKIPVFTKEQAAGLLGNLRVETGRPDFKNLDVVEAGSGAGRGAAQYTGVRRAAYDRARQAALKQGIDPNSTDFQQQYFVNEYLGKYDPKPGASLIGWTQTFEKMPKSGTPASYAKYFSDQYFRPGEPHLENRQKAAGDILKQVSSFATPSTTTISAPPPVPTNPVDKGNDLARRLLEMIKLKVPGGPLSQAPDNIEEGLSPLGNSPLDQYLYNI
jgi:hypothetical protein